MLAGCTVVNVPEAAAPGKSAMSALEYAIDRTVHLRDSGCSGILVGGNRLVTAKHCLPDDAKPDQAYEGGVVSHISPSYDFAVIRFPDIRPRVELRTGAIGEHLYVVGYPMQLGNGDQALTVTDGVVAGPTNADGEARITAPIYFGNSGGGVWSDDGALLGISVSIFALDVEDARPMPYPAQGYMVPAGLIAPWL
jgi:hypothetical protein